MTKEKLLETLFAEWAETHKDSDAYVKACERFGANATAENYDILSNCVIEEAQTAYTAGFNAALALMRNTE